MINGNATARLLKSSCVPSSNWLLP